MLMPQWLFNQLQRAFRKKDRHQIKLLNDCWYFYRGHNQDEASTPYPYMKS